MGRPHDHRCKLAADHPVRPTTGVQVHECDTCPLGWEHEPRTKPYTGKH